MHARLFAAAALGLAVASLAADAPPPDPAGPARFVFDLADGTKVEGEFLAPTLTLETDTGSQTIKSPLVRRVTFRAAGAPKTQDAVELADKTVIRGRLTDAEFGVKTQDTVMALAPASLREMKAARKEPMGVWSAVLGLLTLAAMEIVLGLDNLIFLAIVVGKLPPEQQPKARKIGLAAALGTRLLLLFSLSFLLGMTKPLFTLPELPLLHDLEAREVSLRDLVLLLGGAFLIGKSTLEMHEKLEAGESAAGAPASPAPTPSRPASPRSSSRSRSSTSSSRSTRSSRPSAWWTSCG